MKPSENANEYHIHISSDDKALNFNFKELLHYRDLIGLLTKKTFILTYKQTIVKSKFVCKLLLGTCGAKGCLASLS